MLEPALGVEIREMFLRYRANDISLANDILDRIAEQVEEDEIRVHNRAEMSTRNRELAAEGKRAGCSSWDYAELHNSGYRGLYNGLDADGIHTLKKLTKSQKILDHMNAAEGAANVFRVTQAKLAMQTRKPKSPAEAFKIAHDAGVETRAAMKRIGGVMPEEMLPADSLSEARKRLKENKAILCEPIDPKKIRKKS
jgi:DNA-damage-inducible protein D